MFCKNCGESMDDLALVCPKCGTAASAQAPPPPPQYQQPTYQQPPQYQPPQYQQPQYQQYQQPAPVEDNPTAVWKLLGFCIPLVGLILYFVWKDQKPLTAKALGKFAIIGMIVGFVCSIAYFIIIFVFLGASSSDMYDYNYHIVNFASRLLMR
ncbi:MAG: hypothetical protein WCN92_05060 [Eubacteriales bacterium]